LFARIRSAFRYLRQRDFSERLSQEFQFHIDSRAQQLRARGIPSSEAYRRASIEFAGVKNFQQQCRETRGFTHSFEILLQDLRFGLRVLRKSSVFSVVVILTLALGIGMNTAIFSAARAVFSRSTPFPESRRLVYVSRIFPGSTVAAGNFSYPGGRDIARQNSSLDEFAMFQNFGALALTDGEEPVRVQANYVEPAHFELLGAAAASGRLLRRDEDRFGSPARVVVISDGFWRRAFASSPDIVGRTIHLNQRPLTVIGVMSGNFRDAVGELDSQPPPDVWVPLGLSVELSGMFTANDRGPAVLWGLGRLRRGRTLQQANDDLAAISANAAQQFPATDRGFGLLAIPLRDELVGKYYGPVWLLAACSAFILLIGCANVANLLISRAVARRKEFSVRAALGAGSRRIASQLLIENLILTVGAAALGLLVASWAVTALNAWARGNLPSVIQLSIDRPALAVFAAISLLTALLFGGGSALLGSRANLAGVLSQTSRGSTGAPRTTYSLVLVCAEVAMSVALLAGSGLLVKSLRRLTTADLAFNGKNLLTLRLDLRSSLYADPKARARFADGLLGYARAIPGAESAFVWGPAMIGRATWVMDAVPEGRAAADPQNDLEFSRHSTNPGGLSALGVSILRGRDFDAGDTLDRPLVAVVSESRAKMPSASASTPLVMRIGSR
jgi:putative ABC transport system permease protein